MTTAAKHGSTATINIGGTSTAFTAEAVTLFSGAGTTAVYQITSATKQYWDPTVAVVLKDGVTTLTEGVDYEVESYLYGRVRLLGYTVLGTLTLGGSYLPMLAVDRANSYSLSVNFNLAEVPQMDGTAMRRLTGLTDVTFNISRWEAMSHDYDTGADSKRLFVLASAGTTIYIEFTFGTGQGGRRLACKINKDNLKTDVNNPVSAELEGMVAAVKVGADFSDSNYARP